MTAPELRALPGPISAIRLTYTCERGWWDTGEDEPEIWHVAADLYDWEGERSVEHVGDFEFYRAGPYATRDLFGVLDGDISVIAESILDPATGHIRDDLDESAEPFGSGMLPLNSAQMACPWRGFGVGVVLARQGHRPGLWARPPATPPHWTAPALRTTPPATAQSAPSNAPGPAWGSAPSATTAYTF
ncbi:hypothetical protein F7R91_37615 [Streptomyces luteolifulvus]|uniref:Uncharacterized protein n=1 Tax=Streptomyces luteolifulvus TaxID=2615112 RepID=A0A6H9UQW1_9ACTN|nr:hypothetical protein [Streptomyces luteolifulvus]KAB1139999.1 hypothetical protein F7R91_37615 [Streptomyces luteolifulvus]